MSKVFIEEETLIGIGNAIREKNGTTDLIATTNMATAISNLATGGGGGGTINCISIPTTKLTYSRKDGASNASGGNWNVLDIDVSEYVGLENPSPFVLIIRGNRSSNYKASDVVMFYDGSNWTKVNDNKSTGGTSIYSFIDSSSMSFSNGIVNITLTGT